MSKKKLLRDTEKRQRRKRPCINCGQEMAYDPRVGAFCVNIGCISSWTAGEQHKYPLGEIEENT